MLVISSNISIHYIQTEPVLVSRATNRQTITDGSLRETAGLPGSDQSVGKTYLNPVGDLCLAKKLPDLTAVMVSKETGEPGTGRSDAGGTYVEQEKVYAYDGWFATTSPVGDS